MKTIIFVINYFGNGGAATVMKSLITKFLGKYNVILISFLDDNNKYDIPSDVMYIPLNNKKKLSSIDKLKSIIRLRKILKSEKDSIIISFEYFINMRTILAKLGLKNKLIISERNDPSKVGNKHKNIRNILYRFADILVCQTDDAKNYFPKYIRKKTTVILNPLKEDLPEPYQGIREKIIVNFCRLERQKNLTMLIDAFDIISKKYPDYKLYIYGDGKEKEDLLQYINIKKLDKKIKIYPFNKDILNIINKYAMYISTSNYEGLSNSMLESMAIGLPVICTDCPCGGAKMIIKDGENGFLTKVNDFKLLSEKIEILLDNKKLQDKVMNNAIKLRDELSIDVIAKKWENIIKGDKYE